MSGIGHELNKLKQNEHLTLGVDSEGDGFSRLDSLADHGPGVFAQVASSDLIERVFEALGDVPVARAQRAQMCTVLEGVVLEGRTFQELGKIIGMTGMTAINRYRKA